MMNYAMILQNRVIGVLTEQDAKPCWPPSPSGKEIKVVECDDSVRIGMIYDPETGTFSEYIQPELEPQKLTEQEQIIIDTALTVEYMACLMEANLG